MKATVPLAGERRGQIPGGDLGALVERNLAARRRRTRLGTAASRTAARGASRPAPPAACSIETKDPSKRRSSQVPRSTKAREKWAISPSTSVPDRLVEELGAVRRRERLQLRRRERPGLSKAGFEGPSDGAVAGAPLPLAQHGEPAGAEVHRVDGDHQGERRLRRRARVAAKGRDHPLADRPATREGKPRTSARRRSRRAARASPLRRWRRGSRRRGSLRHQELDRGGQDLATQRQRTQRLPIDVDPHLFRRFGLDAPTDVTGSLRARPGGCPGRASAAWRAARSSSRPRSPPRRARRRRALRWARSACRPRSSDRCPRPPAPGARRARARHRPEVGRSVGGIGAAHAPSRSRTRPGRPSTLGARLTSMSIRPLMPRLATFRK